MKKTRVGVIGCGGISHFHMNGYKELETEGRVELVACCDIDGGKVVKFAEKYGFPRSYTDAEEMMKNEELDCVSVCVWNSAHKDCTIAALRGGANVLCEKPMALNAKESQEMYDEAKKAGKLLQLGFVRRFGEDAEAVQKLVSEGTFGDIYYAKATYLRQNGCPGGWFGDKKFSGGGPLIDLGVHVIDLTRYLAGCPKPVSAYGVTYANLGMHRAESEMGWHVEEGEHPYNVEDLCAAMIRFDNGLTMSIEASFNLNIEGDVGDVQLFGTRAGTSVNTLRVLTTKDGRFITFTPEGEHSFRFGPAFGAEIRGFVDASEGKAPCKAPAEDGVWLMKIIDAIYESARTGVSVEIK